MKFKYFNSALLSLSLFSICALASPSPALAASPAGPRNANAHATEDGPILHAWSWSFDNIAKNMRRIADAGYKYVQTSPANTCYVGDGGGMALFSQEGDSVMGKWYYYYQPTDWQVGNYMLGNRDQFRNMCDSAYKYHVKVIVDVLPNHTAIDHNAVLPSLDNAVGGHENLYHANGFTPIRDYNDRLQCTTGEMGGLPDVNTENPDFQHYYLQYVNDLINLGARGFRYDTAKHIGLPSDPLDPKASVNNFWDIVTGRQGVKGLSMLMPDSVFIYGEVLQDKNTKEDEYEEYMAQTASGYGHVLREVLAKGSADGFDLNNWGHPAKPQNLVTWVESHDTYANAHESAGLSDEQIRAAWTFLTARAGGSHPLFFSRPAGSTRQNYWGNNRIGEPGNDEYFAPEIVAANNFRNAMYGTPETLALTNNGAVALVTRGTAPANNGNTSASNTKTPVIGLALVNFSDKEQKLKVPVTLPDGQYTDAVSGAIFKVRKGDLTGKLAPLAAAHLYAN